MENKITIEERLEMIEQLVKEIHQRVISINNKQTYNSTYDGEIMYKYKRGFNDFDKGFNEGYKQGYEEGKLSK